MTPSITAVSLSPRHGFSKQPQLVIHLLANQGVQGDAHCGSTVQHLYLKRRDPAAPNLMQVHLLQSELFADLAAIGFSLTAGQLGENITTAGIDLLTLPFGTRLHLGAEAVVELTGLRTPCKLIDKFQPGLLKQVVERKLSRGDTDGTSAGRILAKAGVMSIVLTGGAVASNDPIRITLPPQGQRRPLQLI